MKRQEFLVEVDGIIGTIHTYTRNPFMVGYTRQLKRSIRQNDIDTLCIILDKVIEWYTEEIEAIKTDDYIFNKNMHEKAYHILKQYRSAIQL